MTRFLLCFAVAVLANACTVPPVRGAATLVAAPVPDGMTLGELDLGPIVSQLTATESTANIQYGMLCLPAAPRAPSLDRLPLSNGDMARTFVAVLEPLRYKLRKPSESVFAAPPPADYLLGGAVTKVHSNICFPMSGSPHLNTGDLSYAKGSVFIEIKWELYSAADRRVVFQATTQGRFEADSMMRNGYGTIALNAFAASLRNVAAQEGFAAAIRAAPPATPQGVRGSPT